jgi:hypothetical protein
MSGVGADGDAGWQEVRRMERSTKREVRREKQGLFVVML